MPSYTTRLVERKELAERTTAFYFEKPVGFEFKAGQSLDLTLIDPPETDAEGNTRTFTIASAPYEKHIMVATRMRDTAFKRVLGKLTPGTQVKIEAPFGDLTLHNNAARPAVFLAGGIGITPFRSIVLQASHDKRPHRMFLFYSNRRPEDAPFLQELEAVQETNPRFKFVGTMTGVQKSKSLWNGETGYLNKEMLERYLETFAGPMYYIAGPPALVSAMRTMLNNAAVDDDDIRTEEFSGY